MTDSSAMADFNGLWTDLRGSLTMAASQRNTGFAKAQGFRTVTDYDGLADVLVPIVLRLMRRHGISAEEVEQHYIDRDREVVEKVEALRAAARAARDQA